MLTKNQILWSNFTEVNMSISDLMDELEEKMMNAEEAMKHDFMVIWTFVFMFF